MLRIDLTGEWHYILDSEKRGLEAHYELRNLREEGAATMQLPGTTALWKLGERNDAVETGFLTEEYPFSGYLWLQKAVDIKNIQTDATELANDVELRNNSADYVEIVLERTRISHLWIGNEYVGSRDSFVAPHIYDITGALKGQDEIQITLMISNVDYKVPGGHMTSPDTQTNWCGVLGDMAIQAYDGVKIKGIQTNVAHDESSVQISATISCSKKKIRTTLQMDAIACRLKPNLAEYDADCDVWELSDVSEFAKKSSWSRVCEYLELCEDMRVTFSKEVELTEGDNQITFDLKLSKGDLKALSWDEENPWCYHLELSLGEYDAKDYYIGLKSFEAKGNHFYINGRRTFLRGKHDGMIFPLTGFAPMNVEGWLRVMKIARNYGINHYRYHTCCPPEAAFIAADLLGIYLQPETCFWGTFAGPEDEGYCEKAQTFLEQEGFRMLESFSHHPSFCMMSLGNELWGNPKALNELLGRYKAFRPQILYTQGSNNFQWVPNIQSNDDFFSGVRFTIDRQIRGSYAQCDAPLGHVQIGKPGTRVNYESAIHPQKIHSEAAVSEDGTVEIQYGTGVKRVKLTEVEEQLEASIPVVSHEIGQYETYPDYRELGKYKGVLKPRNLETFRKRLQDAEMGDLAAAFQYASGHLAMDCYKAELEAALRTDSMAGFQILDIQDFTGQGTALVGVLDAFMESKGLISPEVWRCFCSEVVVQAEFDSYIVRSGEELSITGSIAWFRKDIPSSLTFRLCLSDAAGNVIHEQKGLFSGEKLVHGRNILGDFQIPIPNIEVPSEKWCLSIEISDGQMRYVNEYKLWSYADAGTQEDLAKDGSVLVTYDVESAKTAAIAGKPVLLYWKRDLDYGPSVEGAYCTDFWCYPMFRSISESMNKKVPIGTMGLLVQNDHEALKQFASESYATPEWFSIVQGARIAVLDEAKDAAGQRIQPIVQMVDNFERNHRLGLIYEQKGILVCTSDLPELVKEGCAEAKVLHNSLLAYLSDK